MSYDFDVVVDRSSSNSLKWDIEGLGKRFKLENDSDYLPLWVADMDFKAAPHIIEALQTSLEHGIFGYPMLKKDSHAALIWWMKQRHHWDIAHEWVSTTPGIVPALNFIIRALTEVGDGVIIQEPVYGPFRKTVEVNERKVINNQLKVTDGYYEMDFEDLEEKAKQPSTKLLILCSPHNPVGRVWHPEELRQLGEICQRHGVIVVSDEIHHDLVMPGYSHTVYATLGESFAASSVICTAPTKTFNLAGMQCSSLIIPNAEIKKKIDKELEKSSIAEPNLFGIIATSAAYSPQGAAWLDAMLDYINETLTFMDEFIKTNMPMVKLHKQEGTYLSWLDFSALGLSNEELDKKLKEEAKVLLNPGVWFGQAGQGYMRINLACPRSIVQTALERIAKVINK